jgi:Tfp pilus assembly protein PilZ/curved DNA-binding protein CbpA
VVLPTEARPKRLIPRYPFAQHVQLRIRGDAAAPRSYPARDVSQGGFFLETRDAFELFSDIDLDVRLPSGEEITLAARIVHVLTPEKAQSANIAAGIGVQFEGLNEQQLAHVRALVSWARANDPRPRIACKKPDADLSVLQSEPMLAYLFEHIDGQRDPEALAEELGIEVGSVERMLRELSKRALIELVSASGEASPSRELAAPVPAAPQPPAASTYRRSEVAVLSPKQAEQLQLLEQRSARGNLYVSLDVPESADLEAIRARYQALSSALRAFVAPASDAARIERLQNHLREAFGVLSSPQKRSEYDQYLERARSLSQAGRVTPEPPVPAAPAKPKPQPNRPQAAAAPKARPAPAEQQPLGAAAQLLLQAEQAYAAGKLPEAGKHLQLLTAMTFEDAKIRARVAQLKTQVSRTLAVDFEKQAAYEEKQQKWALAARSWQRVADGRPKDSAPLQRAALALMQAGGDLKPAIELAKRAVELADNDPEPRRVLARLYDAAGMQANARRELEAAQRCASPTGEEPAKDPAKPKAERGLFKRLLGREAPN